MTPAESNLVALAAEEAVSAGLSLISLHAVLFEPTRCACSRGVTCPRIGKHPVGGKGWQERGVTDERSARLLGLGGGVGVLTGAPSRAVVLDVDPRNGGEGSLATLLAHRGALPATRTVLSGRGDGGRHHYFRIPDDVTVRNSSRVFGPGIDVLSKGRFVVAPPSMHPVGGRYQLDPAAPSALADLPADLLEPLTRPRHEVSPVQRVVALPSGQQPTLLAVLVRDSVAHVARAQAGYRNLTLNVEAYGLGQLVGAGYLDAEDVAWELVSAAVAAGLDGQSAFATACSGLADGADCVVQGAGSVVDTLLQRARSGR